jgi:hypothetical protein
MYLGPNGRVLGIGCLIYCAGGVIAINNILLFGSVVDPGVLDKDLKQRISDEDISVLRKLNKK